MTAPGRSDRIAPDTGRARARRDLDVVVVGGGVVGATAALALAGQGLSVALVEAREPPRWEAARPDLRVYALAPDTVALLRDVGAWDGVERARAQPYRHMRVWDAGTDGELHFDADRLGRASLGWIVEHGLLVDRLWAALPAAGVRVHCPALVDELQQDETGVRLRLDDGQRLDARLAIAADGADSALRALAGLAVSPHDYAQRGVVAFIETDAPHEGTAWQRFLPGGPVAVLPFAGGRSSIVWTLPETEAARLLAVDDAGFDRELTAAFGGRLGGMRVVSPRAGFPLRRQLAPAVQAGRVLVVGDAAHVVHPLAGQGVNLGLRDVGALRDTIAVARQGQRPWDRPAYLARWARTRVSEAAVAAFAFEGINHLFSNDRLLPTLLRGRLLGLAGALPPVASLLWRRAAGV